MALPLSIHFDDGNCKHSLQRAEAIIKSVRLSWLRTYEVKCKVEEDI